jgi:hypothetical protein
MLQCHLNPGRAGFDADQRLPLPGWWLNSAILGCAGLECPPPREKSGAPRLIPIDSKSLTIVKYRGTRKLAQRALHNARLF